ncbi:hypothetical protein A3J77_01200 [Candidatus Wolfebacteria bacterium RBG_13_41_7]|uniref:DUF5671 domain-containing protein n=1 Tax=Candidatus Wolfebacteria bacterium RBG_13_41_7 TaxID=1802554 RepID=A0A1F8DL92_9BACT|nr:MAG: hypothetical protein A3J77_01200 [Candidatus Wolfebacteria bacterium RBG_13_41_7]
MENIQTQTKLIGPKDVFLEFWLFGTLYLSAVFVVTLFFQYINYFFEDLANPYSFSQSTVRWTVAILIAVLPTHIFVLRLREKDYLAIPEKREARLRKWLTYLTLFIASITCVVDFATLVFYFLDGEISVRFILKVLAVATVAGGVLWYYLTDLRRTIPETPKSAKLIRIIAVVAVIAVIAGAFFISGSPFAARDQKIDSQRESDLQGIQSQIIYHWQKKGVLPTSLSELTDSISGYKAPNDPETGVPYEYKITDDLNFELCATFSTEISKDNGIGRYPMQNDSYLWDHGKGKTCFERSIDPQLYSSDNNLKTVPIFR